MFCVAYSVTWADKATQQVGYNALASAKAFARRETIPRLANASMLARMRTPIT
jgi:hypothetical protein